MTELPIFKRIRIEEQFLLPDAAEAARQLAVDYWSRRGVVFGELTGPTLSARRGSLWGNLTSFDMNRLITELTLTFTPAAGVACMLEIDTSFQVITEWNRLWWKLELDGFRSYLLTGDEQSERWREFRRRSRRHSLMWAVSSGNLGTILGSEDRAWLERTALPGAGVNLPIPGKLAAPTLESTPVPCPAPVEPGAEPPGDGQVY